MLEGRKLALIGVGTMGRTLARGLITSGAAEAKNLCGSVAHAERAAERAAEVGIEVGADNGAAAREAEVIVLCVKPKGAGGVVCELAAEGALDHDPLLVSIAAGVRTETLEDAAGRTLRVVRAMPNTPCRIGQGMSVLSGGRHATDDDLAVAEALMRPLGRVLRLDEEHMDAVTGLSASGPAFIYVIIEALAEGGVMVGLPRRVATELAAQTVQGAARMVIETGRHPASLKDDVTTPAGCTVSALLALEDGKLRSVLARGVQEAARSAASLGRSGERQ
ncbi:MAG: pyrroline-5-carboxylate reductase [Planctomycetota bacterium]|jgi:pyrroline-5-carboxylate reductase|nr:pyrroline-5-carboxylate reductase [Planctomycetota bacterium]MDP6763427.1 pyrroline-5-carboxylate reductase [Planctomycetota bacterium]MDP6990873.1 pyrroline-5-carboxylate reductase [Planctomycetota bacterium]